MNDIIILNEVFSNALSEKKKKSVFDNINVYISKGLICNNLIIRHEYLRPLYDKNRYSFKEVWFNRYSIELHTCRNVYLHANSFPFKSVGTFAVEYNHRKPYLYSWRQLCRHWRHQRMPSATTKLASWQLSGFGDIGLRFRHLFRPSDHS